MKRLQKYFLRLFVLFTLVSLSKYGYAQCNDVTISATTVVSTCQQNGEIHVTLSGPDVGNLRLSDAEYSLEGTTPRMWAQAPGGILTNVGAGSYIVKVRAFCNSEGDWVVLRDSATATVTSTYTVPNYYITSVNIRNSLPCIGTGIVPVTISGGRAPYTINIVSAPGTYTGSTTRTATSATTFNVDSLTAGSYVFSITDNCGYNLTLAPVTVGEVDLTTSQAKRAYYQYAIPTEINSTPRCDSVYLRSSFSSSSYGDYYYYFYAHPEYFEYTLLLNGTGVKNYQSFRSYPYYVGYKLPDGYTLRSFRENNCYITPWIRVKGTTCEFKLDSVRFRSPSARSPVWTTCSVLSHYPWTDYDGLFCYPYQYRIIQVSGTDTTVIQPWKGPVNNSVTQYDTIPQSTGLMIQYQDNEGVKWITTVPNKIYVSITSTGSSACMSDLHGDTLGTSIQIYRSSATFPAGTRFRFLSGPLAPTDLDVTITSLQSDFYPYSTSNANHSNQSSPYPYIPLGQYQFEVTMPGCTPDTVSITPNLYYIKNHFAYTVENDTCNGLWVTPTAGQLAYKYLSSGNVIDNNTSTYFSIETAPSGVTYDKTAVTLGGRLFLPASGRYVLKMTSSMSTNSNSYCAKERDTIDYVKQPLQLDNAYTIAYVCQGASTGYIRVRAKNGSGHYTYELYPQGGGGTPIQTNTTGIFYYGTAGTTYTIKVHDNGCGTNFPQDIEMLDLASAHIAYSGEPDNNFCANATLQLKCITLGETTYHWTGPGGWTSNLQNPTIPPPWTPGTYTVSVTPESCGSAMSESVTIGVSPTYDLRDTVRLCYRDLPFTYRNDTTFAAGTTTGTYVLHRFTTHGCDSVTRLRLEVSTTVPNLVITNPAPVSIPNTTNLTLPAVTAGSTNVAALNYYANATCTTPLATPTAAPAGIYYIVATAAGGCTDTAQVIVNLLSDDTQTVQEYRSVEINVLSNDSVPTGYYTTLNLFNNIVTQPVAGTLTVSGTGSNSRFVYTNNGTAGLTANIDSFKYTSSVYNVATSTYVTRTSTVYIYVLQDINKASVCSGSNHTVSLVNKPAGVTFTWYQTQTTPTVLQTGATRTLSAVTADQVFWIQPAIAGATAPYNLAGGFPRGEFTVWVANKSGLDKMRWTGWEDKNWHNPRNWTGVHTSGYEYPVSWEPVKCVDVVIPADAPHFPELMQAAATPSFQCRDIEMLDRAMLKNPHVLDYDNAKVTLLPGASERDRFVMWSAPLKSVYSGDYHFKTGGTPNWGDVYMNFFERANPAGGSKQGNQFTQTFGEPHVLLDLGTAFNVKVVSTTRSKDVPFTFPQSITTYTGADNVPHTVTRTNSTKFITHGVALAADSTFSLKVDNDVSGYSVIQVVNPYLAYLNISQFLASNSSNLQGGYLIWNGNVNNGLTAIIPSTNGNRYIYSAPTFGTPTSAELIPPLQSFFVQKRSPYNIINNVKMSPKWTTTSGGSSTSYVLRSAATTESGLLLVKASQGEKIGYALLNNEIGASPQYDDQGDVVAVFIDEIPLTLYSLTPDGQALFINSNSNYSGETALGLRVRDAGEVRLDFSGVETFGYNVYLADKERNLEIDLQKTPYYTFTVNKTGTELMEIDNRFFLRTGEKTGMEEIGSSGLLVSAGDGILEVRSTGGLIENIEIFNVIGSLVYRSHNASDYYRIPLGEWQIYIVKAQIGRNMEVKKVYVK